MLSIIIQARMGSTRFPGKILEDLNGKPVLEHLIDTCNKLRTKNIIDDFLIATPDTSENQPLWNYLELNNIRFFKGSNDDVLDRYYQAAQSLKTDKIIRICSDTPLIKEWQIVQQINNFEKYGKFSYGNGCWIFSFNELEESWKHGHHPEDREHVVTRMFNSVDYPDDLERIQKM
jgi:spore coat polysaccharide biosynthesis protein SpsF (cytidylyltransferase family)